MQWMGNPTVTWTTDIPPRPSARTGRCERRPAHFLPLVTTFEPPPLPGRKTLGPGGSGGNGNPPALLGLKGNRGGDTVHADRVAFLAVGVLGVLSLRTLIFRMPAAPAPLAPVAAAEPLLPELVSLLQDTS